ncbi:hypothetical protein MKW94_024787 [Papaver nudicaule]|uniref:Uncharacterized protein n=1 Tax=Papaver nudicaule TaxID=74823 RepID=A0AA41SIA4_PAPNU|nr:hypothetical protein [Papaver nudicaule]
MNENGISGMENEYIYRHHKHDEMRDNQCSSALVKHIKAPLHLVWSLVRRFDQPQKYKSFISRFVVQGDLEIGSVREVNVKSRLPATTSTERLELLDDEEHILRIMHGERQPRVSLWEIEPLTTFPMYPSSFPLRLKRPWPSCLPNPLVCLLIVFRRLKINLINVAHFGNVLYLTGRKCCSS